MINKKTRIIALSLTLTLITIAIATPQNDSDSGIKKRKAEYLKSLNSNSKGAFGAVARYARGLPIDLEDIQTDLDIINSRLDCSDFILAGFLRLLYLDAEKKVLDPEVREAITNTVLNFKYWIDEPGIDSMCYWSENHQILYHSAEYLAGNLFPDEIFPNSGMTGREHIKKARKLITRWFEWRERFGFSEWLSNVYYEEDLYPLLNLIDFSPDEDIRTMATMMVDVLALNIALNSYRGNFTSTHGRTYEKNTLTSKGDKLGPASFIWWGVRELPAIPIRADYGSGFSEVNFGAVALATSTYNLPPAIYNIGIDTEATFENYQSHGVHVDEAPEHGISHKNIEDGMFYWGMGMYTHPTVANVSVKMWEEYNLSKNSFFYGITGIAKAMTRMGIFEWALRNMQIASEGGFLHDAHTYTYRTPDYMLSSVLDWRKGRISSQNLAWCATLGHDALVFTTYPGKAIVGDSPGYWTGNASTPRIAQYKNILIAIYKARIKSTLGETYRKRFTHAWFPAYAFDKIEYSKHWTFGKKGSGYIALYSHKPVRVNNKGPYAGNELIARGSENFWICIMGSAESDGTFEEFIHFMKSSSVNMDRGKIKLSLAGHEQVEFGWNRPFVVNGKEISLRKNMRYDNPYVQAERFSDSIEVKAGDQKLTLDFKNHVRDY